MTHHRPAASPRLPGQRANQPAHGRPLPSPGTRILTAAAALVLIAAAVAAIPVLALLIT